MKRVALFALLILTSCGYRFGSDRIGSVYVPFAQGDKEGQFTALLVSEVSSNGAMVYNSCNADYVLEVCLGPPKSTNIGFTYAPNAKFTVSNEARLSMSAKVSLVDAQSGERVLGPLAVTSFLSYDFEPDLSNIERHSFSLGQLEMNPLARKAATPALYAKLAQKIVDSVVNCW